MLTVCKNLHRCDNREVLYASGDDGLPVVTGLLMADKSVVTADAYVGALDVPGAKKLIPEDWREIKMVC